MPWVRTMIEDCFRNADEEAKISHKMHPVEDIAIGAATIAKDKNFNTSKTVSQIPLTIGIELADG